MAREKKYQTAKALRRALEDRLLQISEKERIDLQRLRKQVAFDRLLGRFFNHKPCPWALKGGYAMELRVPSARATRDIDLTLRSLSGVPDNKKKRITFYQDRLQAAANLHLGDFFEFVVGGAMMDLDAAPYGGARFPIESIMDDRTFIKFHLDLAAGDFPMEPLEIISGRDWLGFAGIPSHDFLAIPREQQFAEKLHAYTRPRTRSNSRVRDLVDLVLLINSGSLGAAKVLDAIAKTFDRRKSHTLPDTLEAPPVTWRDRFGIMAKECNLPQEIDGAFKLLQDYFAAMKRSK